MDGATLKVDNAVDVVLGFGVNVGTGVAASIMQLANTGAIKDYGYDPLGGSNKAARQIVVGAHGTVNVTVDNTSGIVPYETTNITYAVFTNAGVVTKTGCSAGGYYSIYEPWYQHAGSVTINAGNQLRFYGQTGRDNTSEENRGKSFFMDGGTLFLKGSATQGGSTLWVASGYQQDNGGSLQCSSADVTNATTWVIDATASNTNKIRLNGSNTEVGSVAGDYGSLKLLTGGGSANTGVYWQLGNLVLENHTNFNGTYTLSKLVTNSKVDISDVGSNNYKVQFAGVSPLSGTLLIIDTGGNAITSSYDPSPPNWVGAFTNGYQMTYTGGPGGGSPVRK